MKCVICGKEIKEYGNSANPVVNGTCCNHCNNHVVIPYRIFLATLGTGRNTALLIKPDGCEIVNPKDKYFTLEELQNLVEGYIEVLPPQLVKLDDVLAVVNEEGIIRDLEDNNLSEAMLNLPIKGNLLLVPKEIFEKEEEV